MSDELAPLKARSERFEIAQILSKKGVRYLFHFTDERNWTSVQSHGGLFSRSECTRRGIKIAQTGGSRRSVSRDRQLRYDDYVHLCYHWDNPMKYARQRCELGPCVILQVSTEVMYWRDTKFSDVNALDRNATVGSDAATLKRVRFDLATKGYGALRYKTGTARSHIQAEVLVWRRIPLEYLKLVMTGC